MFGQPTGLQWADIHSLDLILSQRMPSTRLVKFLSSRAYRADIPEVFRQWIYWLIESDPTAPGVSNGGH